MSSITYCIVNPGFITDLIVTTLIPGAIKNLQQPNIIVEHVRDGKLANIKIGTGDLDTFVCTPTDNISEFLPNTIYRYCFRRLLAGYIAQLKQVTPDLDTLVDSLFNPDQVIPSTAERNSLLTQRELVLKQIEVLFAQFKITNTDYTKAILLS